MVLRSTPEKGDLSKVSSQKLSLFLTGDDDVPVVQFKRRLDAPNGPTTQLERLQWPSQMWNAFTGVQRDRLIANCQAMRWCDYFAGMGSRAQIQCMITFEIIRHLESPIHVPPTFCVTESDPVRQKFLEAFADGHRSVHACSDIMGRLGAEQLEEIQKMQPAADATILGKKVANQKIASYIRARYVEHGWSHAFCPCIRHPLCTTCPVLPVAEVKDGKIDLEDDCDFEVGSRPQYLCITGGPPCRDVSAMNAMASGDGGPHFQPTSVFLCEFNFSSPDLVYVECTKRWNPNQMQAQLHDHRTMQFHVDGNMVGDVYKRPRMGCLSYKASVFTMAEPLEHFLLVAESWPVFDASNFWSTDVHEEYFEMLEWKKVRRCTVPDEALTWECVMLDSQHRRLAVYEEEFKELVADGKVAEDVAWCADLDQAPENNRGRFALLDGSKTPTLIQHGWHWHSVKKKPLTALDGLRMHGWPVTTSEISLVGSVVDIRSKLKHHEISHRSLIRMTGDSWHLRYQGMLLMFVLATLVDIRVLVPRSPVDYPDAETPSKRFRRAQSGDTQSPGGMVTVSEHSSPRSTFTVSVHSSPGPGS